MKNKLFGIYRNNKFVKARGFLYEIVEVDGVLILLSRNLWTGVGFVAKFHKVIDQSWKPLYINEGVE